MRKPEFCIIVLLLFLIPIRSKANHVYGGELQYTHISGLTYQISLTIYGDCGTSNQQGLLSLNTATPNIAINDNQTSYSTIDLSIINNSGNEITPICNNKKDSTQCTDLTYPFPGIRKYVYTNTVTLPYTSATWNFVFNGNMGSNISAAGRSSNLTNIVNPGNQTMYLIAELNNVNSANSSPNFTSIPTPFYCINIPQQYNQGAVDPDNDSLVFQLAPALVNGSPVSYITPYSGLYPMSTSNGQFSINPLNGQISFTPNIVQSALVVNKVVEYRNGVQVGSSLREMTFITLNNCQSTPPSGSFDLTSVVGGKIDSGNVINVCANEPVVKFEYPVSNSAGDTINITYTTLPAGATINVLNNNTPTPTISFNWNTLSVAPGIYNFYVTIKAFHCPLNSQETRGFTIRVVNPFSLTTTIIKPTQCAHRATIQYTLTNGVVPRVLTITQGGTLIKTYSDSTGVIIDSISAGNYHATISSPNLLCSSDFDFQVVDSGVFPYTPITNNPVLCIGTTPIPLTAIGLQGATIHWYDFQGNLLSSPPVPPTDAETTLYYLVSQQRLTCESAKDTVKVIVTPKPNTILQIDTGAVCLGEKIYLKASGAAYYQWLPSDSLFYEPDSSIFIRVYGPATYTLIASSGVGCKDTIHFSYSNIVPCCTFSYPDAFTPNNDGRNDTWKPIMYGNSEKYELSIYNRWGIRLFDSFIPNEGWNGYYEGKPQEIGTYFFYLKAKCVTGKEEENKGSFMLIR